MYNKVFTIQYNYLQLLNFCVIRFEINNKENYNSNIKSRRCISKGLVKYFL